MYAFISTHIMQRKLFSSSRGLLWEAAQLTGLAGPAPSVTPATEEKSRRCRTRTLLTEAVDHLARLKTKTHTGVWLPAKEISARRTPGPAVPPLLRGAPRAGARPAGEGGTARPPAAPGLRGSEHRGSRHTRLRTRVPPRAPTAASPRRSRRASPHPGGL